MKDICILCSSRQCRSNNYSNRNLRIQNPSSSSSQSTPKPRTAEIPSSQQPQASSQSSRQHSTSQQAQQFSEYKNKPKGRGAYHPKRKWLSLVTQCKSLPPEIHSPSSPKPVSPPSRGQTFLVLEELGRIGTGSLGGKHSKTWLYLQLLAASSSLKIPNSLIRNRQSYQELPSTSQVSVSPPQRCYRDPEGSSLPSILLQTVSGPQARRILDSSNIPQPSQSLYSPLWLLHNIRNLYVIRKIYVISKN